MQTAPLLDGHWPALLARLSGVLDLDASARASGALRRRRAVADGAAATAAGLVVRHIRDPPRRRPSQSALARVGAQT